MRQLSVWATIVATLVISSTAQITKYVADMPACGLNCLMEIVPPICGLTNLTCMCTNQAIAASSTICFETHCTVIETLHMVNITSIACGVPVKSEQGRLEGAFAFGALAFIAIIIRLISRWRLEHGFKIDDYIMMVVFVLLCAAVPIGELVAFYGFGQNMWDLTPPNITKAIELLYFGELLYLAILGCTKISVLMFYLRIFPSQRFIICCYITIVWVSVCTVVIMLVTAFQCLPVSYQWDGWKGTSSDYKCLNMTALIYSASGINVSQDFVILLLPIPWLLKLHIGLKKKIHVIIMFSMGILVCITSIIRLTSISSFRATRNPTKDYTSSIFWTALESYVSVIVPCLPAIRSLLSWKYPAFFGKNSQNDSNTESRRRAPRSQSYRLSTIAKIKTPMNSEIDRRDDEEYLGMGIKAERNVYNDVGAGGKSDDELVADGDTIAVSKQTTQEDMRKSATSLGTW